MTIEKSRLFVTIEQHFVEFQGDIYTDIAFAYSYWQEYLKVFDKVCPIARVRQVKQLPDGWQRADGPSICFVPVTDYLGFWDFLKKAIKVLCDCYKGIPRQVILIQLYTSRSVGLSQL
ncbi:hypothetical protein ES703_122236 [subsurface metagenome]